MEFFCKEHVSMSSSSEAVGNQGCKGMELVVGGIIALVHAFEYLQGSPELKYEGENDDKMLWGQKYWASRLPKFSSSIAGANTNGLSGARLA